ncbi:hypothetical protein RUND412_001140 [Rhizina undulata]
MNRPASANSLYTSTNPPSHPSKVLPIRSSTNTTRSAPASGVGNYIGARLRQATRSSSSLNRESTFGPKKTHSRSASITDLDSEDESSIGGFNGAVVKHEYTGNTQTHQDEDESYDDEPPSISRATTPRPLSIQRNLNNTVRTGSPSPKIRSPRSGKFPQQIPDLRQFLPNNGTDIFADNDSTPSLDSTTMSLNSKRALLERLKLPIPVNSFGQPAQQQNNSTAPWGKPELVREKSEDSEIMEIQPGGFPKGGVSLGDALGGDSGMGNDFGARNDDWEGGGGGDGGGGNLKTENDESYYDEQEQVRDSYGEEFDDPQQGDGMGYESDGYEEEPFNPTATRAYDRRAGSIAYGRKAHLMSPEPEIVKGRQYQNPHVQQEAGENDEDGNANSKSELWSVASPTISSHDWLHNASGTQADENEKRHKEKNKQKLPELDKKQVSFSPPRRHRSPVLTYPAYSGMAFSQYDIGTKPHNPPDLWRAEKTQESAHAPSKKPTSPETRKPNLQTRSGFAASMAANAMAANAMAANAMAANAMAANAMASKETSPDLREEYSPPSQAVLRYSSHALENPSSVDSFKPLIPDSQLAAIRTYADLESTLSALTTPRHSNISRAELPTELNALATYSYPNDPQKARDFFGKLDEEMFAAAGDYICSKKREVEDAIRGCREKRRRIVEGMEKEVADVAEKRVARLRKLEERREMLRGGIGRVLREGGLWL